MFCVIGGVSFSRIGDSSMSSGISLHVAIRLWRKAGGVVEDIRGTGELKFSHPVMIKTIRVNKRRKDTPREVTKWLRRLCS